MCFEGITGQKRAAEEGKRADIIDIDDRETDYLYDHGEEFDDFIPPSPVPEDTSPPISDNEKR